MRHAAIIIAGVLACTAAAGGWALRQEPATAPATSSTFPDAWLGRWSGPAQVQSPGRAPMEFTTELIVTKTDDPKRFGWTIIYDGAAGRQERKYELVVVDAAAGRYEIDEKNGIILPSTLIDGALHSRFEVGSAQIATRERLVNAGTPDAAIEVEMVTATTQDPKISGGGEVPEVRGYIVRSVQSARLNRVP